MHHDQPVFLQQMDEDGYRHDQRQRPGGNPRVSLLGMLISITDSSVTVAVFAGHEHKECKCQNSSNAVNFSNRRLQIDFVLEHG